MKKEAPYPLSVPEYGKQDRTVTAQSLTAFHVLHGLQRIGKVMPLVGHPDAKTDPTVERKIAKAASEVEMAQYIPDILAEHVADHPPFGLPKILPGETLGRLPLNKRGVNPMAFLTHWQTNQLRQQCLGQQNVKASVECIAAYTQRSIATIMLQAFTRWKHEHPEEVDLHTNQTASCNMFVGLPHIPMENLLVATGNSNNVMWRLLELVPELFERDTGLVPTVEQATDVARNSVRTLELLASAHFQVFVAMNGMFEAPNRGTQGLNSFNPKWFCLRRVGSKVFVAIRSEVLQGLEISKQGSRVRTMCAALLARSKDKSTIAHVYDRNVSLAQEMVYPTYCISVV